MDRLRASCPTRLLKQGKLKQLAQDHETDSMSESQCHGLSHFMQWDTKFVMNVKHSH